MTTRTLPAEFTPSIQPRSGLPAWTNHLAFDAVDLDGLAEHKRRWLAAGHGVAEIDHGWCTSIYIEDPNGIMVEFCATTREFTAADRDEAGPDAAGGRAARAPPATRRAHPRSTEQGRSPGIGSSVTRIGHYDNPYLVAEWHRDPPAGTPVSRSSSTPPTGRSRTAGSTRAAASAPSVLLMHPRANFSHHYVCRGWSRPASRCSASTAAGSTTTPR